MLKESHLDLSTENTTDLLFNPQTYDPSHLDERSRDIMLKTIAFFEQKGKRQLKEDDRHYVWYSDFLDFLASEKVLATLLTPSDYSQTDGRWDTRRNCDFNEIISFYGLHYSQYINVLRTPGRSRFWGWGRFGWVAMRTLSEKQPSYCSRVTSSLSVFRSANTARTSMPPI